MSAASSLSSSSSSPAAAAAARSLFRRYADQRLSSVSSRYVPNTTVDSCAVSCLTETQFQCRSFTYDNRHKSCLMYTVNVAERDVRLLAATDVDLYDCRSLTVCLCLSVCLSAYVCFTLIVFRSLVTDLMQVSKTTTVTLRCSGPGCKHTYVRSMHLLSRDYNCDTTTIRLWPI